MIGGCRIVWVQTLYVPRMVVPLAYDSGGVTTSTVPGRSALLDGFGLIALASLFPMITVMGYAQLGEWQLRRRRTAQAANGQGGEVP